MNREHAHHFEDVKVHYYKQSFQKSYVWWIYHGENFEPQTKRTNGETSRSDNVNVN